MPQLNEWGRNNAGEILWKGSLGKRARYHQVKIPDGMWSTGLFCVTNGEITPQGTQWIQVQYGWSYHERLRWTQQSVDSGKGWPIFHIPVPNIPPDPATGNPGQASQYGHPANEEVLNTAINPRTNQPEKNFTRLAVGQNCFIKERENFSAEQLRDFYTMPTTYSGPSTKATVSRGWVARIGADGLPAFVKF